MHAEMLLILIVSLVVAQVILVQWKQRHFKSYQVEYHELESLKICIHVRQRPSLECG